MNAKNKSGKIALFGLLALLVVLTVPSASADCDVYFRPDPASIPEGECHTTTVQILINCTDADRNIEEWGTLIAFDYTCVNITDVEYTNICVNDGQSFWNWNFNGQNYPDPNYRYVMLWNYNGSAVCCSLPNGTVLANLTVHCENTSYCESPLNFYGTDAFKYVACLGTDRTVTWHNGTVLQGEPAGPEPDLNVTSITVNADCPQGEGYAFANECNNISAEIKEGNGTTVTDTFYVRFNVTDPNGVETIVCEEEVSGITGGTTMDVWCNCSWVPTIREVHYINVTVDSKDNITEIDEGNNSKNVSQMVYWNGYKGKRWAPWDSGDIETEDKYCEQEHINLTFSVGDSYYLSSYYHPHWTTHTANWTAANLSIPAGATIKQATLFLGYTWDKKGIIAGNHWNVKFNEVTQTLEQHDWDRKGFGSSNYPAGLLKFNVTDDFDVMGNNATFTNTWSGGGNMSMQGMVLVVVYQHDSEPRRMIWINKGFDSLWAGGWSYGNYKDYCVNETEATAFVPFENCPEPIDKSELKKAELITITTDAFSGDNMNKLYFNTGEWYGFGAPGNKLGATGFGANTTDVLQYLNPTDNVAKFQSTYDVTGDSDNFYACLGILKLEKFDVKKISVEPEHTTVQPQDQFEVDIKIDPMGHCVYGIQYELTYDPTVVRAETQVQGDFLSQNSPSMVVINKIDHANGKIEYAETAVYPNPGATTPCTGSRIQFTAIGEPNTTTYLNLTGVMFVDCEKIENKEIIINNGTVEIHSNTAPVANASLKFQINNAAKKYDSFAEFCACNSLDPDSPDKGGNISYIRWDFGDGQYGTSEGMEDCQKKHKYTSWKWVSFGDPDGHYEDFTASLTVTDDGCPQLSNTTFFNVTVYIAGDADGDGKVNIIDAVYVGHGWRKDCPTVPPCQCRWAGDKQLDGADLNNDCLINIMDAVIVGANWRHTAW